ncbi:MAG: Rpn family recombination-promoting nuclease/putative transposase [Gemmatimonadetes bacterium]|nr:Rpn family recombination-promoting nuclease/putative transposase [Gemmatimonadota bacterium]MCY3678973.1 Rpn family recombination-promoting nuclease/putative transposase [Gemmatimonadota bacterium]MYA43841.1 Rpn family recombination-promoting nuclease/putative transposase [Gemmatimonadota bacterium]MYE92567.1 Rpn family recombination-promoting nuclease/putative transposase [Gemmatimonadota bacterium]MYJ10967.1 Rpn family recombination-promoting nuclease/putative transposase [Gemmatimonadota 
MRPPSTFRSQRGDRGTPAGDPTLHDPAFKRLFGHRVTIEGLVRSYAPEKVAGIDFSTLDKMGTELVGEAMVRRYPDMLWIARKRGATGWVVILLEFQAKWDRLMALRMAVYQLLTVQELLRRMRPSPKTDSIEILSFLIYHGEGTWRAVPSLQRLFTRWVPGGYQVIARDRDAEATAARTDLAQAILKLERDRSPEATLTTVEALRQVAEETSDDYDHFMAECVAEVLVSTRRITRDQLREVRTMGQMSAAYHQSMEEYGRKWFRPKWFREGRDKGRDEGIRQGRDEGVRQERREHVRVLCRRARERFGRELAEQLAALLGDNPDPEQLLDAAGAVVSCSTGDELLNRVRSLPNR